MIRSSLIILCICHYSAVFAQPGALDPAFNGLGYLTTPIGNGDDVAQAMVVQPDGKIVLAGYTNAGAGDHFALCRYNVDGTLDESFSDDGKQITTFFNGDERIAAAILQADGKILVAGYVIVSQGSDFALARYLPDGTLDETFSGDGMASTNIGGLFDNAYAIALQADGSILVAGIYGKNTESDFALVRYKSDGSLDNTFGQNGISTLSFGPFYDNAQAIAIQPDGKIVLAGFTKVASDYDFALARFNDDGTPDSGFGVNGKVITPVGASLDYGHGLAIQADGKILVSGYTAVSASKYNFALLRYLPDGTLDDSFNGTGKVTTAVGNSYDESLALALQTDGKIIASGYSYKSGAPDFAMVQYRTDGIVDSTFGVDGIVSTPIGSGSDQALAIGFTPDGKIALAGRASNGSNLDFAAARYFSGLILGQSGNDNPVSSLSLAPNPLAETAALTYDLKKDALVSLRLYDLQGKLEQTFFQSNPQTKGHQEAILQMDKKIPGGVHILVINTGDASSVLRVIKQ